MSKDPNDKPQKSKSNTGEENSSPTTNPIELETPPNAIPTVQNFDFTNMTESEIVDALKSLPKDVADIPGFVRDEIAKIEKAQAAKK